MATQEELQALANQEVEDAKPIYKYVDGVHMEFDEDDYAQKKIDIGNQKWEEQQFGYIQVRQEAYGSIQDQLDMMYWDNVNSTTTWKDHIDQVKSDNPKPS